MTRSIGLRRPSFRRCDSVRHVGQSQPARLRSRYEARRQAGAARAGPDGEGPAGQFREAPVDAGQPEFVECDRPVAVVDQAVRQGQGRNRQRIILRVFGESPEDSLRPDLPAMGCHVFRIRHGEADRTVAALVDDLRAEDKFTIGGREGRRAFAGRLARRKGDRCKHGKHKPWNGIDLPAFFGPIGDIPPAILRFPI
jgi:hypothetical protein